MKKSSSGIKTAVPPKSLVLTIGILLIALTFLLFGRTFTYPFINFVDLAYILERPQITRGLTLSGIHWSLTHARCGNWHPLDFHLEFDKAVALAGEALEITRAQGNQALTEDLQLNIVNYRKALPLRDPGVSAR